MSGRYPGRSRSGSTSGRRRLDVVLELEKRNEMLLSKHNDIVLAEMKSLVIELRELVAARAASDSKENRHEWSLEQDRWAERYQEFVDLKEQTKRAASNLPREEAVSFRGDNAKAFWAHFEACVYRNDSLDPRQKMSHLLSRLKEHSEASRVVAGFDPSGSQLEECVAAFKARYLDNKLTSVEAIRMAKALPFLPDFQSIEKTTHYISQVRLIDSMLKENETADLEYIHIMQALVSKLPPFYRARYAEHHYDKGQGKEKEPKMLATLIEFVQRQEGAARISQLLSGISTETQLKGDKRPGDDRAHNGKKPRTDTSPPVSNKCALCGSTSHPTRECTDGTPEERFRRIRAKNLCFRCVGHVHVRGKPCHASVSCTKCKAAHISTLCGVKKATTMITTQQRGRQCLTAVRARLAYEDKEVEVNVFLDTCAETTLITETIVKRMNGTPRPVPPLWLTGVTEGLRHTTGLFEFELKSLDSQHTIPMKAHVTPLIVGDRVKVPSPRMRQAAVQQGIPVDAIPAKDCSVDLLIGQDQLFPFWLPEIVPLGALIGAFRTKLGWMIAGRESDCDEASVSSVQLNCHLCNDLATVMDSMQLEDGEHAVENAKLSLGIEYDKERMVYTVRLPKRSLERLDDNYGNALRRLESLRRKLKKDGRYPEYHEAIMEYVRRGYAEVSPTAAILPGTYTIPHHAVYKSDAATTKLRVVFDASSSTRGRKSLNQCLSKGEPLNVDVWAVTLRFRLAPIVLTTDLVKAFSQIQVHPDDRNLLRYLWYAKPEDSFPTTYRMASVSFGVTSSPYLLGAILRDHADRFRSEYPLVAEQMETAVYVDDVVLSADNLEEAEAIMKQAKEFFAKASFQLHPWSTNATTIATDQEMAQLDKWQGLLGMRWKPTADVVRVKEVNAEPALSTRREAVSLLSQHYDVLSLFAPLKTRIRHLIRELAPVKNDWDAPLSSDQVKSVQKVSVELGTVSQHDVPRRLRHRGPAVLHVFCDASPQAYGAVAYLCGKDVAERILLCASVKIAPKQFVMSDKKKQAPKVTVPRLELMAAVMGVQLYARLRTVCGEEMPVAFYSDSEVTLKRIAGDPNQYEMFEMNRLQVIHEWSNPTQWHFVPTEHNPADLLTRDAPLEKWLPTELWWYGPKEDQFELAQPVERSVSLALRVTPLSEEEAELLRKGWLEALTLAEKALLPQVTESNIGKVRPLDSQGQAKVHLLKLVQRELFPSEIARLAEGRPLLPASTLRSLRPFLDEWGVMRSKRQMQSVEVDWEVRNPIILASHGLVRSMIREEHARLMHTGARFLRSHLANCYHIVRCRRVLKSVIGSCADCNRERGKHFVSPESSLPSFRTEKAVVPFQNAGLDYLGPLKTRGSKKMYILLITCAVTRAVHLELVPSQSAKHCLNALERFFSRRGLPKEIHSDNAPTFGNVDRSLSRVVQLWQKEIGHNAEIQAYGIRWVFQVPRAPWWGGFFERLVQLVKRRLQHTEIRQVCNLDEMLTVVAKVEAVINSRPLVDFDAEGLPPLTPAHFLVGQSLLAAPPLSKEDADAARDKLLDNYRKLQTVRDEYANRLRDDYILELRRHAKEKSSTREPRVGETVIVANEQGFEPDRFVWPTAQIKALVPGKDGNVRMATIAMRGKLYNRPVQSLIPLEGMGDQASAPRGEDVAVSPPASK